MKIRILGVGPNQTGLMSLSTREIWAWDRHAEGRWYGNTQKKGSYVRGAKHHKPGKATDGWETAETSRGEEGISPRAIRGSLALLAP